MNWKYHPRFVLQPTQQELLEVLENTRSRLAVAVAAESKHMSQARWRFYFETDMHMRRCIRRLRRSMDPTGDLVDSYEQALASLKRINSLKGGDAHQLCRNLYETLLTLNQPGD